MRRNPPSRVHAIALLAFTNIKRLNTAFVKAMKSPDILEKMSGLGAEAKGATPEEFAAHNP